MPFQPTYPKPYNEGVDITKEDGISFECTVDDYDTVVDAHLYLKNVNTGKEILRIESNPERYYKQLACNENFKLNEDFESGHSYEITFELPNIPRIYLVDSEKKLKLLQEGTQFSEIQDGTYSAAAYRYKSELYNGFRLFDESNYSFKVSDYRLPITFSKGNLIVKGSYESGDVIITLPPYFIKREIIPAPLTCSVSSYVRNYSYGEARVFVGNGGRNGPYPPHYSSDFRIEPGSLNIPGRVETKYTKRLNYTVINGSLSGSYYFDKDKQGYYKPSSGGPRALASTSFSCPQALAIGDMLINPGYGYSKEEIKAHYIKNGNCIEITIKIKEVDEVGQIISFTLPSGTDVDGFMFFDPPPAPTLKFKTTDLNEFSGVSWTGNTGNYLLPPKKISKLLIDKSEKAAENFSVQHIDLVSQEAIYSIDGGQTYKELEDGVQLPSFPIIGGKGEESRMLFGLSSSFIRDEIKENLSNTELTWFLRLYGEKEDVFIYSGENFKIENNSTYGKLAILANNSNIRDGSVIYKNYRNNSDQSRLIGVENSFSGLNISKVLSVNSLRYYENVDGVTTSCELYKINLNSDFPIEIPSSPYIKTHQSEAGVMVGMKCLLNGLEYELIEDKKYWTSGSSSNKSYTFYKGLNFDSKGRVVSIIIKDTNASGAKIAIGAIQENMRVEIYRDKCIAKLENENFNLEAFEAYTIWTNSLSTQQYYFNTNNGQEIFIEESPTNSTSCNVEFNGIYTGELLWHKWELYKTTDGINYELIKDTGEICSTDLNIKYDGLDAGVEYKVKLVVSNNLSQVVEEEKSFYIGEDLNLNNLIDDSYYFKTTASVLEEINNITFIPPLSSELVTKITSTSFTVDSSRKDGWYYFDARKDYNPKGLTLLNFKGEQLSYSFEDFIGPGNFLRILTISDGVRLLYFPSKLANYEVWLFKFEGDAVVDVIRSNKEIFKRIILGNSIKGLIDCDNQALKITHSFPLEFILTNKEENCLYKLENIFLKKNNLSTSEIYEEVFLSKTNNSYFEYSISNGNDYSFICRAIYRKCELATTGTFGFYGNYAYLDSENKIYTSSSGLSEKEVVGDYEGEYQFLKYHWNKIVILDTEKRLSEDTEDGLYYISKEPYSKWDFQLNLGDADVSINTDSGTFDGLYQFPRINETYRNYKTQSLSCGLGKIDNSTNWRYGRSSVNLANEWQKFCNNGHIKILRDQYGNLLPVKITAKSYKCSNTKPMIMDISFDWTQVGPEEKLIAIETCDKEVSD